MNKSVYFLLYRFSNTAIKIRISNPNKGTDGKKKTQARITLSFSPS